MNWRDHPCFSCSLPDCDETDRRCGLKRAHNDYNNARKQGQDTAPYRAGNNAWWMEFHEANRRQKQGKPPRDVVALVERGAS